MSSKKSITKNLAVVGLITLFVLTSAGVAFAQESKIIVSPNRFVVLDDPNTGTKAPGFFDPTDVTGGSWNSNYWSGESTTIRSAAQVLNSNGQPQSGIIVSFTLKNPGDTVKNTAQSITDNKGIAYYSFNLNEQKYWGYWIIEANATVSGVNVVNKTSFALNWWGCNQCHGSENPGNWGTMYTPKSYYTMGYDFHKSQDRQKHTEVMSKGNCIICHQMYNGTPVDWGFTGNTPTLYNDNEYSPDWHKGKTKCQDCHEGSNRSTTPQGKNPEIAGCYDTAGCHAKKNNNLSSMFSTTGYVVGGSYRTNYSFIPNNAVKAHTGPSIPCISCHNAGHNITKPFNTTSTSNTFTEYQQCTSCHQTYSRHNNNVSCTVCHSQDVHDIKVLSQSATYITGITSPARGNCTNCHQNSTFQDILEAQPKAGSYSGNGAPIIPDPLKHSSNILNGTIWGTYWTSEQGSCYYCHTNTKHNSTALGSISSLLADPTNIKNGATTITTWCAGCHYNDPVNTNYLGNKWNPIPPTITVDNTGKSGWQNHSGYLSGGYKDSDCQNCHALNGTYSSTSLNLSHSLNVGQAGGPNCISCHNIGGSAGAGRLVNFSAMNDTNAVHKNLNSGATSPSGYSSANFRCWACHGTGSEPGSGHPSNYRTPYRCPDCHVQGADQNLNFTPAAILNVTQHYWNGASIKTAAVSSCNDCHNKSEMMVGLNLDPDGAASVYGGANGGSNSTSHYGKKRSDYPAQGTNDYCYQCHNNPATAFPFIDVANKTIANHSTNYASSPNCADCHASQAGRIHNSTLYKPVLSLPNSTFCLNCHGTGGSATIKNKEQHNGTLDCTQCHLNSTKSIHPVQYLQNDGTSWGTARINAVNCTNCHQDAGVSGFDSAPKVPEPVNHSTSPSAGQKWGIYWDNTSQLTACYYCHQIEIHENNTDLLGNVSVIKGSNTLNNPDLANSTWCANCHYAGAQDYKGNLLAVSPPEITDSSLVASDGTLFFNHSGLTGFNDSNCKSCHGRALSGYSETSLNLSHSVSEGGGENCIECHGTNYIGATPSVTSTFVNISAFNESIHQNINNTPPATMENIDCWSCHYNKDMNRLNVKKCGDCHRKPSQWHGNAAITTNLSELW